MSEPIQVVVTAKKMQAAIDFLMRRSSGTDYLTSHERKRFFAEYWRGPFYRGMTERDARQLLSDVFNWTTTAR